MNEKTLKIFREILREDKKSGNTPKYVNDLEKLLEIEEYEFRRDENENSSN